MKRKIAVGVALGLTLALVLNMSVFAAWVGSLRGEVRVEEPIVVAQALMPMPEAVYPGETFGFGGEVSNQSSVTYGIRLDGFLWFWWMVEGTENVAKISLEEVSAGGEVQFSPAAGPSQSLGIIVIHVNGSPYFPGSVINIGPGVTYEVRVLVTTSYDIPTGRLGAEVYVTRQAPVGLG